MISNRAQKLVSEGSVIVAGHMLCASDPFSDQNRKGYLNFGIAENHLMSDWTVPYVNQVNSVSAEELQYFDLSGTETLKLACSHFFQNQLGVFNLKPDNFVVMNGLSSVCEALSYVLFSEGDYVMLSTPFYSGFEFDFTKRFGVNLLNVPLQEENSYRHSLEAFVAAYENFPDKGKIKAVLICHPHNPTGEVIDKQFLKEIVQFAKERDLEVIADEIYALTHFKNDQHNSVWNMAESYQDHVHLLYGLAKDFTLAGLKVGLYYTENEEVLRAMQALTYFHCTSSLTQSFAARLLKDDQFISDFMLENNRRLLETKQRIKSHLPGLKVMDGDSGLFFVVDLRGQLSEPSFAAEDSLFKKLLDNYRIFLTPGSAMGMAEPGFFRFCFARPQSEVTEVISRLKPMFG